MYQDRVARFAALALVVGAVIVPAASARVPAPEQDMRNADNRVAAASKPRQDLRSPDAVDAAAGRGTFSAPDVVVVKMKEPQPQPAADGIDWGDAGIGAGGLVGFTLVSLGGALLVVQRRHAREASHA